MIKNLYGVIKGDLDNIEREIEGLQRNLYDIQRTMEQMNRNLESYLERIARAMERISEKLLTQSFLFLLLYSEENLFILDNRINPLGWS